MKLVNLIAACAVAAVAIVAAFVSAGYAYEPSPEFDGVATSPFYQPLQGVDAPGYVSPLLAKEIAVYTNQGIPPSLAIHDIEIQSKVGETELPGKLQTAMGISYAGAWFEGATGQLHFGVTTTAARRKAENVIASVGLTDAVTLTLVRSTSAQLIAAQNQWDRKLAHIAHEGVMTGLEPQHNAVAVTLSRSLPSSQRAALEREAAAADVNMTVTTKDIGIEQTATKECNLFSVAEENANCEPSITAGVRIWSRIRCKELTNPRSGVFWFPTEEACEDRKVAGTEGVWQRESKGCTAGPAALNKKLEVVLLTAGHCFEGAEGEWLALTRGLSEKLIGHVIEYRYGGEFKEKLGDYGDITIEPSGGWQTGNPLKPVLAVTAEWDKLEESRYPIKGERLSITKWPSCHEGATIGEWCGESKLTNVAYLTPAEKWIEGSSVDERMITEAGDSGGPVLSVNLSNEVMMEGTMSAVGMLTCAEVAEPSPKSEYFNTEAECLKPREFKGGKEGKWERSQEEFWQPLKRPEVVMMGEETSPGSLEALNLQLLTQANESLARFLPAEWLVAGAALTSELATQTSGEILLEDTKAITGKLAVLCSGILDGRVGLKGLAWVSEVLNLAGEAISSTPLSGLALECTSQTGCETSMAAKVWPVGLGWEAEAALYEEVGGNFFALLSLPHSGGSNPGWEIECLVLGTSDVDECTTAEDIAELTLEGTKLLKKASLAFAELTEIKLLSCSQGGAESGVVEGEGTITLNETGELTASSEGSVS
jgi:hypothetical protein